jgi:hypothetical protein
MSTDHAKFCFSVTLQTDDQAVLFCLRALCQYVETHAKPQIGWGGSGSADWKKAKGQFKLRFTTASHRQQFLIEAQRLLPGLWHKVGTNDNDPASPQR